MLFALCPRRLEGAACGSIGQELAVRLAAHLPDLEARIGGELAREGRSTPSFEYGYFLADGRRCTRIVNTVAIRPRGYSKATTPPAPEQGVD